MLLKHEHYKKNWYYRRSKFIGNDQNPSVNQHYRWSKICL